jgi:hypothetical protein
MRAGQSSIIESLCAVNIDLVRVHYVLGIFSLMQFDFIFYNFFFSLQQPTAVAPTKVNPAARVQGSTTLGLTQTAKIQNLSLCVHVEAVSLTVYVATMIEVVRPQPHCDLALARSTRG